MTVLDAHSTEDVGAWLGGGDVVSMFGGLEGFPNGLEMFSIRNLRFGSHPTQSIRN